MLVDGVKSIILRIDDRGYKNCSSNSSIDKQIYVEKCRNLSNYVEQNTILRIESVTYFGAIVIYKMICKRSKDHADI